MNKVVAVWWLTCLIWSTVFLAIKVGLADLPPISFAGWRLVVAFLVLTPVLIRIRAELRRPRRDWVLIGSTGVLLLGINYALVFSGARHIPSGLTAVLLGITPAFGFLVNRIVTRERVQPAQLLATLIGIIGLAVIFADQIRIAGRDALVGAALVTASAMCVAVAYVVVKSRGHHIPPVILTSGQLLAGAIPLVIGAWIIEGSPLGLRWTPRAIFAVLYLAVAGSVAAFWLNYWLLKRISAARLMAMNIVEPVIAVLLGAAFLSERLSWRTAAGGAAVLLSIWLLHRRTARPAPVLSES